jgi:thiol-disulfide isomerase/thioredoxin
MDNNNMETNKPKLSAGAITAIAIGIITALAGLGYVQSSQNSAQKAKDEASAMIKKTEDAAMVKKQEAEAMLKKDSTTSSTSSSATVKEGEMSMSKAGIFATYAPDALTKTEGHRNVLFFSATWCPTCQATNKDIQANLDKIDSKIHILSVDYDTSTELKAKYGVTMQHTFVIVDGAGNLIRKTNGLSTVTAINAYALEQS